MRIGIIGSRSPGKFNVGKIQEYLPENCAEIISGGAPGIDTYAEELALLKKIPFKKFLPDYEKYGNRAPLERNLLIVQNCDALLAFWDLSSRGTAYTITACLRENVPVRVIPIGK